MHLSLSLLKNISVPPLLASSGFFLASLTTRRISVARTGFSGKILRAFQHNLSATCAILKILWIEYVLHNLQVHCRRFVNSWDYALAEYCGNIIGSIGLAIFVIDIPGDVCVFLLVQFHCEYLSLYVRQVCLLYIKLERV